MEMICKGCHKAIRENEGKKIGEWLFCENCFQKFLNTPQPSPKPQPQPQPVVGKVSLVSQVKTEIHCHLCGALIEGDKYKKLGDWPICSKCYPELLPPTLPEPKEEVEEPEDPDKESEARRVTVYPGSLSEKQCETCGRKLVEGGYYTVADASFCPNCYYALMEMQQQSKGTGPDAKGASLHGAGENKSLAPTPPKSCESCLREVPEKHLHWLEGFLICEACQTSDISSALRIARLRHKKLLELRSRELE